MARDVEHVTRGSDTRKHILDVAEEMFARYGYFAASVNAIAKKTGLRRASLFHHFPNKQSLYLAVMNRLMVIEAEYFREALLDGPTRSPEKDLEKIVEVTFNFLVDEPNIAYLSLHTLACNQAEEMPTEISEFSTCWWQSVLERGVAAGVFRDISPAECVALVGGMTNQYVALRASKTASLNTIADVDRDRMRSQIQQVMKTLVLTHGAD